MKERIVSKYKNNSVASTKKHIFSRLLDYFSLFVVTYLLFTIFYAIGNRLPIVDNNAKELQNKNAEIAEYIDSTHLQRLNEKKTALLSIDNGATKYVEGVCKTSAYVHNLTFPVKNQSGTYDEVEVQVNETFAGDTNYESDVLSYYFKSFKKNETSLNNYVYDNVDYKDDLDTYQYLKIMKVNVNNYVSDDDADLLARGNGISRYVVLSEEATNKLLKYYKADRADTSIYNAVYGSFINGSQYGIKDVENNSLSYANMIKSYNQTYQTLVLVTLLIYLFSYLVAYLLLTIILRLIAKEWVTLGQKVMGLGVCSTNELEPAVGQLIGYHALNFVLFFTSSLIAFYFMGIIGVLSYKILGVIPIIGVFIGLLVINLVSLFMPFFNHNNHDLTSFIARLNVKDVKEFEGPVGVEEPLENKENSSDGTSEQ